MENLKTLNTTLLLILKDNKILLAEKKRGFATGKFNGIGGKQDAGETIEQTMIRETQEEINVTPTNYNQVGLIHFDVWYKGERVNLNLNIFTCTDFVGDVAETEEMRPVWFERENLPFDKMIEDDLLWLPLVLDGKNVAGKVKLNQDLKMEYNTIHAVERFDEEENVL